MPASIEFLWALPQRWVLGKKGVMPLDLQPQGLTFIEYNTPSPNGNPELHNLSRRYLFRFIMREEKIHKISVVSY